MTVINGRSGSGKSTLLRLIAGLDQPDAGELTIDGRSLAELDREQRAALRRERIGYMPQEPVAVALLSALENVVLALQIRGVGVDDAARRATGLLASLALSQRARQFVSRLSAGETQRVALARALAGGGGLLVLDEPTSRLDEANARLVAAVLARARQEGQTIICATSRSAAGLAGRRRVGARLGAGDDLRHPMSALQRSSMCATRQISNAIAHVTTNNPTMM